METKKLLAQSAEQTDGESDGDEMPLLRTLIATALFFDEEATAP